MNYKILLIKKIKIIASIIINYLIILKTLNYNHDVAK